MLFSTRQFISRPYRQLRPVNIHARRFTTQHCLSLKNSWDSTWAKLLAYGDRWKAILHFAIKIIVLLFYPELGLTTEAKNIKSSIMISNSLRVEKPSVEIRNEWKFSAANFMEEWRTIYCSFSERKRPFIMLLAKHFSQCTNMNIVW